MLHAVAALWGVLHTTGYYSTTVCLGTPARAFELIVDTGSSITSVPCRQCRTCGTHHHAARFDERRSRTVARAGCSDAQRERELLCERCSASSCQYRAVYMEGSSLRGHVLQDSARFEGGSSPAVADASARIFFGCHSYENGLFRTQTADGILGLQPVPHSAQRPTRRRSRLPSVLSALVTQHSAANTFSLCLGERSGLMLLGGRADVPSLLAAGGTVSPMVAGAPSRFTLRVRAPAERFPKADRVRARVSHCGCVLWRSTFQRRTI